MKKRIIRVKLNEQSIDSAIKELYKYKRWLTNRTKKLLTTLADEGLNVSSVRFSQAIYDGTNDVSVSIEDRGKNKIAVVAVGSATLFIEFGTGVTYADDHPEAAEHGMVRGGYGHGLGRMKNGWRYEGEPGTNGEVITSGKHAGEIHTYGNPANMSMYSTIKELEQHFEEIVKRVFV